MLYILLISLDDFTSLLDVDDQDERGFVGFAQIYVLTKIAFFGLL